MAFHAANNIANAMFPDFVIINVKTSIYQYISNIIVVLAVVDFCVAHLKTFSYLCPVKQISWIIY